MKLYSTILIFRTAMSMVSEPDRECEAILFNDPDEFKLTSHLWTTAQNQTCKIYAGNMIDKVLFEFE